METSGSIGREPLPVLDAASVEPLLLDSSAIERGHAVARSPRLLVSVRNGAEAQIALRADVDLLDVKAPERGCLGRPDVADVQAVLAARDRHSPATPVSVALGELTEWSDSDASLHDWLPLGVQFAKVGLAGLGDRDWLPAWRALRGRGGVAAQWVAVAYADAAAARAPSIQEVVAAAIETRCAGVLIDTWSKQSGRLLDHQSPETLHQCAGILRSKGLFLALAGRLGLEDLPRLAPVGCDILAIRSAACVREDRTSALDATRIAGFRENLRRAAMGHRVKHC